MLLRLTGWGLPAEDLQPWHQVLSVLNTDTDYVSTAVVDEPGGLDGVDQRALAKLWARLEWEALGRPCQVCNATGHGPPACPLGLARHLAAAAYQGDSPAALDWLDTDLAAAATPEECWAVVRRANRRLLGAYW